MRKKARGVQAAGRPMSYKLPRERILGGHQVIASFCRVGPENCRFEVGHRDGKLSRGQTEFFHQVAELFGFFPELLVFLRLPRLGRVVGEVSINEGGRA